MKRLPWRRYIGGGIWVVMMVVLMCMEVRGEGVDSGNAFLKLEVSSGAGAPQDIGMAIQLLGFMTLLTLAPTMLILMTSFTRIVIVLSFVRSAVGLQSAPSNQVVVGLSLFLTLFLMSPVFDKVYKEAVDPYMERAITSREALDRAGVRIKEFMMKQTREKDVEFFLRLSREEIGEEIPLKVVIPAFILSELKTAFQMGFLIFIPFLIIDFLVASVLMAMGMMMMPPTVIALPFKILLLVLVDGWHLVVKELVDSFRV